LPTKGPRQSGKLKTRPTARLPSNKPQNYGQIVSYQTKSPVPLDCPTACTCNLQISDLDRLTAGMLYGLESLQFLYLEYNVIKEVTTDAFQHVPKLQLLFLNNNLLKTLPAGTFYGLTLARLNLRNNHLRYLPVSGVLDQLTALVQVDLFENPWDCSCSILELKSWLEQLSTGTVVNNVICGSPKKLAGEDMRYIKASHFCPNNSEVLASMIPPSEETFPGSTITIETSLELLFQFPLHVIHNRTAHHVTLPLTYAFVKLMVSLCLV
uniref:LRRCT domain-containing protein n=1 Tax=Periophthalmus magnuspinnatus TaxID=409849 RepID=A0A3B4ADC0_9GOBI